MQYERPYEKLIAWREAHALCLAAYDLTKKFPIDERFRLVGQMCRSAYSVPMNIAEGNSKRSPREKSRYIEIAIASLEELHYQCKLSLDLMYIQKADFDRTVRQIHKVSYLLMRLRKALL